MSAGFEIDGEVFWGTNGSIEAYVQRLGAVAATLLGPDDPLPKYLRETLEDRDACLRFLRILDESTQQLLQDDAFSDLGRSWVGTVMARLRQKVVGLGRE